MDDTRMWPHVSQAWENEGLLIQRQLDQPEPRPMPWKWFLVAAVVLAFTVPAALLGIPLVYWLWGSTDLWRKEGNVKHAFRQELLANNSKDVDWVLGLPGDQLAALDYLPALIAARRIHQLKATFSARIAELTAIGAEGDLGGKVTARVQEYQEALAEADTIEKIVQAVVQRHSDERDALGRQARELVLYVELERARADLSATSKAHALGVVNAAACESARAKVVELQARAMCSSTGCDQPRLQGSAYCVAHTCSNQLCFQPSGSALLKPGDRAVKALEAKAVTWAGQWVGTEEPVFTQMLVSMFCEQCQQRRLGAGAAGEG